MDYDSFGLVVDKRISLINFYSDGKSISNNVGLVNRKILRAVDT